MSHTPMPKPIPKAALHPPSIDEVHNHRKAALPRPGTPVFGSIWRIPEPIWMANYVGYRPGRDYKRTSHPGLSCLGGRNLGLHASIPLLFGTSSLPHKAPFFEVCMTANKQDIKNNRPFHTTYFMLLNPILLSEDTWWPIVRNPDGSYNTSPWMMTLSPEKCDELREHLETRLSLAP